MGDGPFFTEVAAVRDALNNERLTPATAPPTLGDGSARQLRDQMARFSSGDAHLERRVDVERAIPELEAQRIEEIAAAATRRRLVGSEVEAFRELGCVVPTETIGSALGFAKSSLAQTVADVELMVRAIGRGEPATPAHDGAVDRLASGLKGGDRDVIARLSVLYQNFDATAALFASTVFAHFSGIDRRASLAKTVRQARAATTVSGEHLAEGETVALSLDSIELEFGAGPHRCPGERLAKRIVAGMLQATAAAGYELVTDAVEKNQDGRPTRLPLRPSA